MSDTLGLPLPHFTPSPSPGSISPLHDPVIWYGINYTGTQITQWDFQNKGKSGWTGASSFVLEVPLRNLRPSVIYSVPFDRIVQKAYRGELVSARFDSVFYSDAVAVCFPAKCSSRPSLALPPVL